MDNSSPARAELRHLLDSVGIETIFGATPDKLPTLSAEAQQALDREGLLALVKDGLVTVDPGALQHDPTLARMLQVLRDPTTVVRVRRTRFGQQPEVFWCAVAGDAIVHMSGGEPDPYRLAYLADRAALLRLIEEFLPLTAVQPAAYARADLAAGDAIAVWDLAAAGGAVAAGQLLKAVGLSKETAGGILRHPAHGRFPGTHQLHRRTQRPHCQDPGPVDRPERRSAVAGVHRGRHRRHAAPGDGLARRLPPDTGK